MDFVSSDQAGILFDVTSRVCQKEEKHRAMALYLIPSCPTSYLMVHTP